MVSDSVRGDALSGSALLPSDVERLQRTIGVYLPAWLARLLTEFDLVGSSFSLDESADLSGIGVEMRWMTAEEMVDEATRAEPGVAAAALGYVPIGICLEGSGDPYFLDTRGQSGDARLVRIAHEAVHEGELDESAVETVCERLEDFFRIAEYG